MNICKRRKIHKCCHTDHTRFASLQIGCFTKNIKLPIIRGSIIIPAALDIFHGINSDSIHNPTRLMNHKFIEMIMALPTVPGE